MLALASFAASIWLIHSRPSAAFYLPFPRFWELMLGSLLAYGFNFPGSQSAYPSRLGRWYAGRFGAGVWTPHNVAAGVGAVLILSAVFFFDSKIAFPGWWALVPTVGTCLIIAAGSGAWLNRTVLSNQAMVSIGLISYPLYLWHWVGLYFARVIANGEPSWGARWSTVGLSFFLAALTFRFVEFPVRTASRTAKPAFAAAFVMTVIAVVGALAYRTWIPTRPSAEWQQIAAAQFDRRAPQSWDENRRLKPYYLGDTSHTDILFFGDSHMESYYPRIRRVLEEFSPVERGVALSTGGGCPPLPGVDRVDSSPPLGCAEFFDQTMDYARRMKFKKIVLGGYWSGYFLGLNKGDIKGPVLYASGDTRKVPIALGTAQFEQVFQSLEAALVEFRKRGVQVYVVLPTPASKVFDPAALVARFDRFRLGVQAVPSGSYVEKSIFDKQLAPITDVFHELSRRTGIVLIDPAPYLCESAKCGNMKDGRPMYTDDHHLAGAYVRNHAAYIDRVFDFSNRQSKR